MGSRDTESSLSVSVLVMGARDTESSLSVSVLVMGARDTESSLSVSVLVCVFGRVSEEGMKIVNTLETIREDVALGTQTTVPPSYAPTPHRMSGTPVVSPYGHHRYRHGQSLLNGLRSPPEMATSRTSRISIQSGHESDVTSQIHVCLTLYGC